MLKNEIIFYKSKSYFERHSYFLYFIERGCAYVERCELVMKFENMGPKHHKDIKLRRPRDHHTLSKFPSSHPSFQLSRGSDVEPMASGDRHRRWLGRLRRRGVLVKPWAHGLAHQTRRIHQDLASPLVRPQARQALLVQGIHHHPRLQAAWRYSSGLLPHRQRRRGRPQQTVRFRALNSHWDHVLHRRFREGEGGLDQLHRAINCSALPLRHRFRDRRLR